MDLLTAIGWLLIIYLGTKLFEKPQGRRRTTSIIWRR
jgi:hypothetical protein